MKPARSHPSLSLRFNGFSGRRTAATGMLALTFAFGITQAQADESTDVVRLTRAGQYTEAVAAADAVLAKKPRDAQMRFLKGVALAQNNRSGEAIAIFTRLTEEFPAMPEPYNNLAVLYAAAGQYEKARIALDKAIRSSPAYATAYDNLGNIHARLASQAYDKALQIDSRNNEPRTQLALMPNLNTAGSVFVIPGSSALAALPAAGKAGTALTAAPAPAAVTAAPVAAARPSAPVVIAAVAPPARTAASSGPALVLTPAPAAAGATATAAASASKPASSASAVAMPMLTARPAAPVNTSGPAAAAPASAASASAASARPGSAATAAVAPAPARTASASTAPSTSVAAATPGVSAAPAVPAVPVLSAAAAKAKEREDERKAQLAAREEAKTKARLAAEESKAKAKLAAEESKTKAKLAAEESKAKAKLAAEEKQAKAKLAAAEEEKKAARLAVENAPVLSTVNGWAKEWSSRDVNGYLSYYSGEFDTPAGMSRKAWADERRARIVGKSRIDVKVEAPEVVIDGNTATVKFRQTYLSDRLTVKSRKTLVLVKQKGKWLIQEERTGS
ncbi:MAG: L,D-transpeptidase Cds6 family protein [Janthinobacterium lividum]